MTKKQKYGMLAGDLLNLLLLLLNLHKLLKKKEAQDDFGLVNGWRGDILDVD
jgi:hypothetical protein